MDGCASENYIPASHMTALCCVFSYIAVIVYQEPCTNQIVIIGDLIVSDFFYNTIQKLLHRLRFHEIGSASGQAEQQYSQKEKNDRMLQPLLLLCATDDGEVGIRGYPINECIEQTKNHKTNQCCLSKQCNICHIEHPKKQAN